MAGWITRVVTVTYGPRYERLPSHVPPRSVEVREPTPDDAPRLLASIPQRPRAPANAAAWSWLVAELQDYAARWGANPLGISYRMGPGAKEGKRGRGPQDYLFQTNR